MKTPDAPKICELDPAEIDTSDRVRAFSQAAVDSLMASIQETGVVKDEILVRAVRHQSGKLKLIAGLHRLEACRQLGRSVPAKVYECSDDWAQLLELDDNIAGAELTSFDTAVFLAKRKKIYEKLHPETKRGIAGATRRWDATDKMAVASFATSAAEKLGVSERKVFRLVRAAESLSNDEISKLQNGQVRPSISDLLQIGSCTDTKIRNAVITSLQDGKVKSASEAIAALQPQKPTENATDAAVAKLLTDFKRAPKEVQRRFVREAGKSLWDLVKGLAK